MENIAKKIRQLSEEYKNYTAENLAKIVRIKSLSLQEEKVQNEVKRQMEEAGFDEVKIDGLGNVIARIGNGKKTLAFDGHVDTVDFGNLDNWNFNPLSGEIKDGFVHGRGTVDQKGGIASFITAGRIIKELGLAKNMSLYFVSSVIEEDCDGLCWKYIVEEDKLRPDIVISTEPTGLKINRGQRGRMEINITFRGVSSHGSAPERGKNAVYMAAKACLEIEKLNERLKHDDFLGKGTVTISEFVSGSPSLCAVADYAKIHLDRRLTAGETEETALAELQEIVKDMDAKIEVLNYEETAFTGLKYGMKKYYPTWVIDEKHLAVTNGVEAFEDLYDKAPIVDKWTFSTNGVTINGYYGIPVIGFGPGKEDLAHSPNEKIPIDDLAVASAFYATYAQKLSEK
ncbi:MAG: YgeY family selenium metabolism-linked hydrolase [Bacteroidia bacterium]|nr:MAG: YgeY family selenium metabolism-linked hydrolase [Bacteroidia bacterium]